MLLGLVRKYQWMHVGFVKNSVFLKKFNTHAASKIRSPHNLVNNKTKETRAQKVKIQYDIMPKCYHTCKLSHEESEYTSVHPELRLPREEEKLNGELNKNAEQDAPPV